jgi:hypothetical protein
MDQLPHLVTVIEAARLTGQSERTVPYTQRCLVGTVRPGSILSSSYTIPAGLHAPLLVGNSHLLPS